LQKPLAICLKSDIIILVKRNIQQERGKQMIFYFYRFANGYYCYTVGKLNRIEKAQHCRQHGEILEERRVLGERR